MLILLGGQGTGKGTLGRILQKIWSATYLQVHSVDSITGNFNAALERSFIVFMDEAMFSGDRRAADALKSLVTEPLIHINEKHQPARQMCSYHRFIAATNAEHFKNTEKDDRRDLVLRVSEAKKDGHQYWQALNDEIENGGVAAMMHDLMVMDLSSFNVRDKPNTKALLEQKLMSLGVIERWWYDCLDRGYFQGDGNITSLDDEESGEWRDFLSTNNAIQGIKEVAGGRLYKNPIATDVIRIITKLCPSAKKVQKTINRSKRRGLALPLLAQARREFDSYIGGKLNWPTDDE